MTRLALLALAILALATVPGTPWSGADFTAGSASTGNTLATANDFNTVSVTLTDPGPFMKGTVTLASTATSERGIASVRYESSPAGAGSWTTACQATSAPFSCSWSTTAVGDGPRDLRAVATDRAGYQRASAVVASRRVDNTLPAVALNDPGAYLSGTESLTATGSDTGGSGVASLAIERRPDGGSWTTICTGAAAPRTCSLDTTTLADGPYELRAVAVDAAGNQRSASLIRPVDNAAPVVSVPALGTVRGTINVPVTASDAGTGVASVRVQALFGGAWTDVCTDTTAPWECTGVDTSDVADGTYDVRAIALDGASRSTTSATVGVRIDNTAPSGASIATTNRTGGTLGRIDSGDRLTLTYSEPIAPASLLAGWSGAEQAISVRVVNSSSNDRMEFLTTGGARINLVAAANDLQLGGNYVASTTTLSATLTQSGSAVTVQFTQGATLTSAAAGTMRWTPSSAATDVAGNAALTTQVVETGGADRDF
jgi:chitinase